MKLAPYIFTALLLALGGEAEQAAYGRPSIQVYFTPGGNPTGAIIETLDKAEQTVLVQAYGFTSEPIADALIQAHNRGVSVEVIVDKSHKTARRTSALSLKEAGIPVWIDTKHAIAHNKVMIIDESIVITGSFNFTRSAEERNAENLLIISNRRIAVEYVANWKRHRMHSEKY